MNLSKKLNEWQQNNLIDSLAVDKINEYEKNRSKPIALWAFGGLGVFTILLGFISIVASNWLETPDWMKLATALIISLITAVFLYRIITREESHKPSKLWVRELLVIFHYGFTLAAMALIGQTYQLGGSVATLLLVWMIITLPLVLLGRGKFLSVLWIVGMSFTYVLNLDIVHDLFYYVWFAKAGWVIAILISFYAITPFLFILLSRIPWLVAHRPTMAYELSKYSWLAILLTGWFSQFLWYEGISVSDYDEIRIFLSICFVVISAMVYFIPSLYPDRTAETHLAMRVVLITVFSLAAISFWHTTSYEVIGAISNVFYMLVIAWAALKIKSIRLFNVMTALICLRLLAVYLEVFGSMFETGVGLVIGGLITLAIVWLWVKKANSVAQYFGLTRGDEK